MTTVAATFVALGDIVEPYRRPDGGLLDARDVVGARRLLPCADATPPRWTAGLARAAVESVAENTSDAHVAPVLWAAAAGAGCWCIAAPTRLTR